ncbi:SufE family protein [Pseudomonas neustonica]|uniref:SufE family protein n=1 Tax=Pseudomonas neustonica TaxID=2487346 RepID=A0ABX9XMX5_9PSED|nr:MULTISPECIES: SufE family protein [Pseudomonas]MAB22826.1 Fe-S cluster assembly protein SufE [Pseudomonadales bacterium]MBA6419932.1 SufE family protein [Pseudomonas sp. 5Ae-yellow]ROZ83211.1 SufE family protein [Pseudomonas sp. SSM44]ROZ85261.1 SufE family protein [Pseudomonas neustonica]|tara:strand:+ start:2154 stop:2573 length:420 start_codon:yes stop_codon:yes gene_type:complete
MSRFGTEITSDDIVDTLSFFDNWEDRYKYIIDLGKELPPLNDESRNETNLVRGCQSQVWLVSEARDGKLFFEADSDAFIVKGLLAVVLAAYNGKTPEQVTAFDVEGYFSALNLLKHLSVTRGNGLRAMVKRIQDTAAAN